MKPTISRPMNQSKMEILWDSFEELAKAIGRRDAVLSNVTKLFSVYVNDGHALDDDMKSQLMEALK